MYEFLQNIAEQLLEGKVKEILGESFIRNLREFLAIYSNNCFIKGGKNIKSGLNKNIHIDRWTVCNMLIRAHGSFFLYSCKTEIKKPVLNQASIFHRFGGVFINTR